MDIVRPVIKQKMRKYGGGENAVDIRFNLLALVDDRYQKSSDKLELLKREKEVLERRLQEAELNGWPGKVFLFVIRVVRTQNYRSSARSIPRYSQPPQNRLLPPFNQKNAGPSTLKILPAVTCSGPWRLERLLSAASYLLGKIACGMLCPLKWRWKRRLRRPFYSRYDSSTILCFFVS